MKTQTQRALWDSLWGKPITKAALIAYLELLADAVAVRGLWAEAQMVRAERIAARFKIKDLILQWRNANP